MCIAPLFLLKIVLEDELIFYIQPRIQSISNDWNFFSLCMHIQSLAVPQLTIFFKKGKK